MNDGGATLKEKIFFTSLTAGIFFSTHPKNVPNANGNRGTPITGATKLMNQFGSNGVIRRNSM